VRHWATGTAAPCTSLFKTVTVDEPVDTGPAATDRFDPQSLWWRHERLHRAAMRDPDGLLPRFVAERDDVEAAWLREPPASKEAFVVADDLLDRWTRDVEAASGADRRPIWVRRYWQTRDDRAGLPAPGQVPA
jgi:hypothetical protein